MYKKQNQRQLVRMIDRWIVPVIGKLISWKEMLAFKNVFIIVKVENYTRDEHNILSEKALVIWKYYFSFDFKLA